MGECEDVLDGAVRKQAELFEAATVRACQAAESQCAALASLAAAVGRIATAVERSMEREEQAERPVGHEEPGGEHQPLC